MSGEAISHFEILECFGKGGSARQMNLPPKTSGRMRLWRRLPPRWQGVMITVRRRGMSGVCAHALALLRIQIERFTYRPDASRPCKKANKWGERVRSAGPAESGSFFRTEPEEVAYRFPAWGKSLEDLARQVEMGVLPLPPQRKIAYSIPFDWSRDPEDGSPLPKGYSLSLNCPSSKDKRRLWEISRLQWCLPVIIAANLTDRPEWARLGRDAMLDFLAGNPVRVGVHWNSAMETALRLFSWLQADELLARYWPDLRNTAWCRGLVLHVAELSETATVNWVVPNNHLLIELAALAASLARYPQLRKVCAGVGKPAERLLKELERQTYADGVNRELSPAYQRFIVEAVLLLRNVTAEPRLRAGLDRWLGGSLAALDGLRPSNNRWPMLADSDGGRVFYWDPDQEFWDFSAVLEAGAAILGSTPADGWSRTPEGCLLGKPSRHRTPSSRSWSAGDSGLRVHHASGAMLVVRGGRLGLGGEGFAGHAHSDLASLHLWVCGLPVIQDTGTYTYKDFDADGWLACRRSSAHAVVQIGELEQMTPIAPFNNVALWEAKWLEREPARGRLRVQSPDGSAFWVRSYRFNQGGLEVTDESVLPATLFLPFGSGWVPAGAGCTAWTHPDTDFRLQFHSSVVGEIQPSPIHVNYGIVGLRYCWKAAFESRIEWSLEW